MKSNHYTHSLYYKLLIGYLIFGLLGFITIATISSEMTYHHLVERESEVLYDEATMIADRCSKAYEGKTINLDSAYPQIEAVSAYLQSDIWILNQHRNRRFRPDRTGQPALFHRTVLQPV